MTDTTNEAPERVWICPEDESWEAGSWDKGPDGQGLEEEYVRADLVQAEVAAALKEAAHLCRQSAELWSADKKHQMAEGGWRCADLILTLNRAVAAAMTPSAKGKKKPRLPKQTGPVDQGPQRMGNYPRI